MPVQVLLYVVAALAAYLLGSIPTGYLVARMHPNVDLLRQGSKKTGATNVLRTLGWRAAAIVFGGDFAKGVAAVLIARLLAGGDPVADVLAGVAAILGHNYSLFIGFRGGRGVTAGLGSLAVMAPVAMLAVAVVAVSVIGISRYVSLGSVIGACVTPIAVLVMVLAFSQPLPHLLFAVAGSALVVASHRDNIGRLLNGTERRLGERVQG